MIGDMIRKIFHAIKALLSRSVRIDCDGIPYEFHNVPMKKIVNWIIVEAPIFFKTKKQWGWPTHLQIEPSTHCNLRCAFCPVTTGLDRPTGYMDLDMFKKIIDEVGDYVFLILLWDWGEPFLNPSVYDMISYAKKRGIKIVSSTNGHLFAKGDHAEKLIHSGIDSIIFAMDGITQETYERYRVKGDVHTVIKGIKRAVKAKSMLNSKTPLINLRFLPMKHNEHEIPLLRDFAGSLGVDVLTLKTLNPYHGGECDSGNVNGNEFVPESRVYKRFEYNLKDHLRIRRKRNPCKALWNNPIIHWNGKVSPCTFDPHDHYVAGDLNTETLKDIWSGDHYRKLRRQFREDYKRIDLCSECTYAFEGGSLSTEIIAEAHFFNTPAGDQARCRRE